MKKILAVLLPAFLFLGLYACDKTGGETGAWEGLRGGFTRTGSDRYGSGTLQALYLGNGCVLFEFRLMEGGESENPARDIVLPFVMFIDDEGLGQYESGSEAPLKITVALSGDGKTAAVTHAGEMPISCDGVYRFNENGLDISAVTAAALLEHLPTAATSLNHNLGDYTITCGEERIEESFYPMEAVFDDTGAVLAKFLAARDLSAVYRVDDDIEPVLIFGSAQP